MTHIVEEKGVKTTMTMIVDDDEGDFIETELIVFIKHGKSFEMMRTKGFDSVNECVAKLREEANQYFKSNPDEVVYLMQSDAISAGN